MLVADKRSNDPTVRQFTPASGFSARLKRKLRGLRSARAMSRYDRTRPASADAFSDPRSPHTEDLIAQISPADLIHVHSMVGFVDYETFLRRVPPRTPVVRTLHDMNFFTGGCHYDRECGRHRESCGACPQLGSTRDDDLSRQIWRLKRGALEAVARDRLQIVTPSRWLGDEARRSSLLRDFPVTVIHNGVNTDAYRPRDRAVARELLGLPESACIVLFVAEPINRFAKGFHLLIEAMNRLGEGDARLLVSVGHGQAPAEVRVPYRHLGPMGHDLLLSLVYSAADIFVIPSVQDNCPLTPLEAMACARPVIGFAVGGIPDLIRNGESGLLVPAQEVAALATAIARLSRDADVRAAMGARARQLALEEFSLDVQARRHLELYRKILGAAGTAAAPAVEETAPAAQA